MRILPIALFTCACLAAQTPQEPAGKPTSKPAAELTEKEFAALHELKEGKSPKPTGTMVTIGKQNHYLALPKNASGPMPAVLVIHEWWGLNDHIKHWADRLAADGYAALAVDLYGSKVATTREEASELMKTVDAEQASATLRAAFAFLKEDKRIRATRRASLGWCFGGGWSLRTAIAQSDLSACVVYYGRMPTDAEQIARIQAPMLGVFGKKDRGIPPAKVAAFDAAMKQAKKRFRPLIYDANHAFANPSSARYDQKNAAAAWAETRAFLKQHLTAPAAEEGPEKK